MYTCKTDLNAYESINHHCCSKPSTNFYYYIKDKDNVQMSCLICTLVNLVLGCEGGEEEGFTLANGTTVTLL